MGNTISPANLDLLAAQDQSRITQGGRNGQLTEAESAKLQSDLEGINHQRDQFEASGGKYTQSERKTTNGRLTGLGKEITKQSNDLDQNWNQRLNNDDRRVDQGFDKGVYTRDEARSLDRDVDRNRDMYRDMRQGAFTNEEKRRLDNSLDGLDRRLTAEAQDNQIDPNKRHADLHRQIDAARRNGGLTADEARRLNGELAGAGRSAPRYRQLENDLGREARDGQRDVGNALQSYRDRIEAGHLRGDITDAERHELLGRVNGLQRRPGESLASFNKRLDAASATIGAEGQDRQFNLGRRGNYLQDLINEGVRRHQLTPSERQQLEQRLHAVQGDFRGRPSMRTRQQLGYELNRACDDILRQRGDGQRVGYPYHQQFQAHFADPRLTPQMPLPPWLNTNWNGTGYRQPYANNNWCGTGYQQPNTWNQQPNYWMQRPNSWNQTPNYWSQPQYSMPQPTYWNRYVQPQQQPLQYFQRYAQTWNTPVYPRPIPAPTYISLQNIPRSVYPTPPVYIHL